MKKLLLKALLPIPVFAYEVSGLSVESAYGVKSYLQSVTSPVDIVTGEEIKEKHPFDIRDIIFNRDGFSFSSAGGFGQTSSVYLWGCDPKRTLTFIDGIRINDFTTPNISANYEHLLLEDIEQIEIVKGVQSGVWGADAVAGVINIVTKKPREGFHIKAKGLLGDYNTKKAGISLSFANKKFDILLSYYWFKTSGYSAAEPKKSDPRYGKRWDELGWERDPYRNETFNLKTGWNITENDRFEAVVKSIDAVVHYDAASGTDAKDYDDPWGYGTTAFFNHYSQKAYKLQYSKHIKNNNITALFTKSTFKRSQFGGYEGEYREYTIKDKVDYNLGFVNLGFSKQHFIHNKSGGTSLNKRYHNNGYFITNVMNISNLLLSQSLRHDSYSAFKDKTTWKLGGKYLFKRDINIHGNWGTGYNVPTIDQLYNPYWGNPNLIPEKSIQWDIGVSIKGLNITYFKYSIKDMIEYDFATYKYKNVEGKSKIKGVDASYSIFLEPVYIRLNYTYLEAKDKNGKRLPRRPRNQFGFDIIWYPDENINIGFSGVYVGSRKDIGDVQTGYYTVINAFANMNILENLKFYVRLDNITDKYYQTVDGYATSGRALYTGFDFIF